MSINITFLIPCYNCEKTIERTIDSIVTQNYKDGEIRICCVNDGSKDNTYAKLLRIQKKIKNTMEVYTQPNKGLAGVRTELLKHIKTNYFFFMDSDDYFFDSKCLSAITKASENGKADITLSQNRIVYGKKKSARYSYKWKKKIYTFLHSNMTLFLWNNLFKTSFYKENNFHFKQGVNLLEDLNFMTFHLSRPHAKINYCKKVTYAYVFSTGSYSSMAGLSVNKVKELPSQLEVFLSQYLKNTKYSSLTADEKAVINDFVSFLKIVIYFICIFLPVFRRKEERQNQTYHELIGKIYVVLKHYDVSYKTPKRIKRLGFTLLKHILMLFVRV